MRKFKPGNVVSYNDGNSVAIASGERSREAVQVIAWKHRDQPWAMVPEASKFPAHVYVKVVGGVVPHPDPDPVWADYCSWRLTQ